MREATKSNLEVAVDIVTGVVIASAAISIGFDIAQDYEIYKIIEKGSFLSKVSDFQKAKELQKQYISLNRESQEIETLLQRAEKQPDDLRQRLLKKASKDTNALINKRKHFCSKTKEFVRKTKWFEEEGSEKSTLRYGTDLFYHMIDQEGLVMKSRISRNFNLDSPTLVHGLQSLSFRQQWEDFSLRRFFRWRTATGLGENELELGPMSHSPGHEWEGRTAETKPLLQDTGLTTPGTTSGATGGGGGYGAGLYPVQQPDLRIGPVRRSKGKQTLLPDEPVPIELQVQEPPLGKPILEPYPILNRKAMQLFEKFQEKNFTNVSFQEVRQFLSLENFKLSRTTGSHFFYVKGEYTVTVPYRTKEIALGTLKDGIFKKQLRFTEEMLNTL